MDAESIVITSPVELTRADRRAVLRIARAHAREGAPLEELKAVLKDGSTLVASAKFGRRDGEPDRCELDEVICARERTERVWRCEGDVVRAVGSPLVYIADDVPCQIGRDIAARLPRETPAPWGSPYLTLERDGEVGYAIAVLRKSGYVELIFEVRGGEPHFVGERPLSQ